MDGDDEKFFSAGWYPDMTSILETVKGCEFHFRDSVN